MFSKIFSTITIVILFIGAYLFGFLCVPDVTTWKDTIGLLIVYIFGIIGLTDSIFYFGKLIWRNK